jgi:hypothetical protein
MKNELAKHAPCIGAPVSALGVLPQQRLDTHLGTEDGFSLAEHSDLLLEC